MSKKINIKIGTKVAKEIIRLPIPNPIAIPINTEKCFLLISEN